MGWGFGDVCERKFWGRTRNKRNGHGDGDSQLETSLLKEIFCRYLAKKRREIFPAKNHRNKADCLNVWQIKISTALFLWATAFRKGSKAAGWGEGVGEGFQCTSFLFLEQVQLQKRDLNGNTWYSNCWNLNVRDVDTISLRQQRLIEAESEADRSQSLKVKHKRFSPVCVKLFFWLQMKHKRRNIVIERQNVRKNFSRHE